MQAVVKRRDGEIQRLAAKAEKGPDANQMNLRYKNETNESIILQLNSQVSLYEPWLSRHENSLYRVAAYLCWFASFLQFCCAIRLMQGQNSAEAKHLLQHKLTYAHSQVDFMTSQMTEMQREVDDKLKIEAALKKAEQARKEV